MKILFLDTKPIRRGAQVFLHDLSNEIIGRGHQVKKVYLYNEEGAARLELNSGDAVIGGDDAHFFEKFPTINPSVLNRVATIINEWKPDLILLNGSRTLKYGAALKKIKGITVPLVYRIIDSVTFWNPHAYKQLYYRKLVMPSIAAAVGVSRASLTDVQQLHKFSKPSRVIPRAISTKNFEGVSSKESIRKRLGINEDDRVVLFLGNLTAQKRPDRFLGAIKILKARHHNLKGWIVGDGVLREESEQLAQKLELTDAVRFWGYQSKVGDFIAASDILMLSSDTEGLPGVVLEAGFFGVPTVSTNVGGIKECLEDTVSGFITDKSAEMLAAKADLMLEDEDLRLKMGAAAKSKVIDSFTIERVGYQYIDFFEELLSTCKRK
ncbi:glycosyltransferase family 4 protein [Pontibacter sp. FD36]|uniref:glycosyltransferase family 4 protein n=1 Tax=Pontibacter sp. FD36 TaxID=2789860 RepID=UPI0018AC3939|nr:glycosyltransferase family 4 protein [Pontibacter sp. FD36]MBF8964225.1 glycosyltransferase family 4 protein [Pontibacter sp. FD36]